MKFKTDYLYDIKHISIGTKVLPNGSSDNFTVWHSISVCTKADDDIHGFKDVSIIIGEKGAPIEWAQNFLALQEEDYLFINKVRKKMKFKLNTTWINNSGAIGTVVKINLTDKIMMIKYDDNLLSWGYTFDGKLNNLTEREDLRLIKEVSMEKTPEYFL